MMVNTIIAGLAAELFIFGVALASNQIALINQSTAPLLFMGVLAMMGFPLMARLWDYGVDNLHFELHESALNKMVEPPDSWSDSVLALLDEHAQTSNELEMLVRLIDEAPGAVERQDRRAEAKVWLRNNFSKLDEEDREFVKQNLGYLSRLP